ncbi:MAG: MATE family efflux transporter, partial [Thermoplasmata archaeon]|nr:MATE family efflux transporter [Thermoplasmata archaeon]
KDTYVSFHFHKFRFRKRILKDILKVGIPASVMQLSMSFMMMILTFLAVRAGGTDGVAVFSTGWRVVTIAILPTLGIGTAVVSISAAAYGAKEYGKLEVVYKHALKLGLGLEIAIALATFALAPQIAGVFTQAVGGERIAEDLTVFLRTIWLFYPAMALGVFSSSVFQGVGKGLNALTITLLRAMVFIPSLAYLFAFSFGFGLSGIWWGIVVANIMGSGIAFTWAMVYVRGLVRRGPICDKRAENMR